MSDYSYEIPRHKVFISYHHALDQDAKDILIGKKEINFETFKSQSIFDDCSVREKDIDDKGMSDEEVRKEIRDNYIQDASVLILLCGKETKNRKFIDWELHAAMYENKDRPKLGILVINLPSLEGKQCSYANSDEEKNAIGPNMNWIGIDSRAEYESKFPYMPSRIIDNFESAIDNKDITPIVVVEWSKIENDNYKLKWLIDQVYRYSRNDNTHYNYSAPLRGRNS